MLTVLMVCAWLTSATGVILNYMYVMTIDVTDFLCLPRWNEPCRLLMKYLLVMSIVSLISMFGFILMGLTKAATDQEWIAYISLMTIDILTSGVALGWGFIVLLHEYGRCSVDSPRTYLYSFAFTILYTTALTLMSVTVFMRIVPSLVEQAYLRSRLI